ncbi:MAG: enoyl-CoA hydratase/isomerase family protein [Deltaproteobacteria bacterium]|nr:enoyl-CoA hydratase/isomerase family protein [Deltaproteobacteria bacterium]
MDDFKNLYIQKNEFISTIYLNRPDKANALNMELWQEISMAFDFLENNAETRVIVLLGKGKNFCGGIDLMAFPELLGSVHHDDPARKSLNLEKKIKELQTWLGKPATITKPVIAGIQGACVGAGLDLVCGCDLRVVTKEAYFQIKEIDYAMVADVGTLQRLPDLLGDAKVRELAFTGDKWGAEEALGAGFVNMIVPDLEDGVNQLAQKMAQKSPLALQEIKKMIGFSRHHSQQESLDYIAQRNAFLLLSTDLQEAMMAGLEKRAPKFQNT